uniref:t-SNARE coiled-coil homology domain-containing protein n=1 Tax=Lactuca sativa TaxID=4236 RepID=A0A9R1W691_LACSA|nr:hypothetical protein LSAT_V11C300148330 [Lactuca sativa]
MATRPSGAGMIPKLNVVILGESLASEEDDLVFPGHDFSQQAHVPSPQKYLETYNRSIEDPGGFWYDIAHQNSIGKRNGVNRFTQRILMLEMGTSKLSRTVDLELTTLSSTHHVELNPSDDGFQERYIVQEIIKEMAKNRPIDVKGKKGFKEQLKTSEQLKQANETDHRAKVSTSKKIIDAKLAKDFQAVLKEFQKARRLSAERETTYTPFVPQATKTHNNVHFLWNLEGGIIEEREQGIQEIHNQTGEVNEISKDLAVLVHVQGAMIVDIGSNIENSHAATAQARIQLSESIFIG